MLCSFWLTGASWNIRSWDKTQDCSLCRQKLRQAPPTKACRLLAPWLPSLQYLGPPTAGCGAMAGIWKLPGPPGLCSGIPRHSALPSWDEPSHSLPHAPSGSVKPREPSSVCFGFSLVVSAPSTVCLTPSLSLSGEFFPDLARHWEAQSAAASAASHQPSPLMAVDAVDRASMALFPCFTWGGQCGSFQESSGRSECRHRHLDQSVEVTSLLKLVGGGAAVSSPLLTELGAPPPAFTPVLPEHPQALWELMR